MKKRLLGILCILLFCSHVMYLKMDSYFIAPNQDATINLYNGTFEKSENIIDRDRMIDASLIGNGKRMSIEDNQWTEKDSITKLNFKSGNEGTWVAGVSTKARNFGMEAEVFNNYLEHEGIKDMIQQRTTNNTLDADAVEKYSKHVKAIFQVGDKRTADWQIELGYPIEFVPLSNPYEAHTGDTLQVKLLRDGQPLRNQLVYADYKPSNNGHTHGAKSHSHDDVKLKHTHEDSDGSSTDEDATHSHANENAAEEHTNEHSHDGKSHTHLSKNKDDSHDHPHEANSHPHADAAEHSHDNAENVASHTHTAGQELRTNDEGVILVNLSDDGIWYLQTIHLLTTEETGLTHESNWATLTFEVSHSHEHTNADHQHDHEDSFPTYIFWLVSIVIIGGLFFLFSRNRKK